MISNFDISSATMLTTMGIIAALVLIMILVGKTYFNLKEKSDLPQKYLGKIWKSPLEARTKYPDVDVFRYSSVMTRIGLVFALCLTIAAFNWTTYETVVNVDDYDLVIDEEIEIEPPRSADLPPPPPPPPPPIIQEVPEEVMIEEDDLTFMDQSIEEESVIEDAPIADPEITEVAPPPPPPPPPPEEVEEEIFKVVEEMPRFPGCENAGNSMAEKKACADHKRLEYIYGNIKYPAIARENGVQGNVVVQFVVDKDGSISNATVVRDIGAGCGDEALRIVNLMNEKGLKWIPGKQRGKSVRVMFILPVRFKIQES
jgi:protein TonB